MQAPVLAHRFQVLGGKGPAPGDGSLEEYASVGELLDLFHDYTALDQGCLLERQGSSDRIIIGTGYVRAEDGGSRWAPTETGRTFRVIRNDHGAKQWQETADWTVHRDGQLFEVRTIADLEAHVAWAASPAEAGS